jgi:flagellar biosynthetic protein FliQ
MGTDMAVVMARHLLMEALVLCAPVLLSACAIGLITSVLQTLTGVQEQTLSTVPRLVVVFVTILAVTPWVAHRIVAYTLALWTDLHRYLG